MALESPGLYTPSLLGTVSFMEGCDGEGRGTRVHRLPGGCRGRSLVSRRASADRWIWGCGMWDVRAPGPIPQGRGRFAAFSLQSSTSTSTSKQLRHQHHHSTHHGPPPSSQVRGGRPRDRWAGARADEGLHMGTFVQLLYSSSERWEGLQAWRRQIRDR
jgi:hypothetical protein